MGCCKCKLTLLALIGAFLALVAFLPDTKFMGFDIDLVEAPKLKLPETFSGPLLANNLLSSTIHLFENEIEGPEAFATYNNRIFTGLADGRIIEILPDSYKTLTHIDPLKLGLEGCSKISNIGKCGRPLGLRVDSRGFLYTVDPINGIWKVDINSGERELVASLEKLGKPKLIDDFVLIEKANGHKVFYITDVSLKWGFLELGPLFAEHDKTGRLISYDTESERVKTEYSNLPLPNGLELTDDKSALLMISLTHRLVYKYQLSGEKVGELSVLIDNLPGEPDNIKRSADKERETFWIGFFSGRNSHKLDYAFDILPKYPQFVRFMLRLQYLIGTALEQLGKLINCSCLLDKAIDIKYGLSFAMDSCKYGLAIEINSEGDVVNSLHSPDGSTSCISEVYELEESERERNFVVGSAFNRYVGRLSLPKSAFRAVGAGSGQKKAKIVEKVAQKVEKVETTTQKPQTTTQKPQTTTQKPTQTPPKTTNNKKKDTKEEL